MMTPRLARAILVALSAFAVTACSGGGGSSAPLPQSASASQYQEVVASGDGRVYFLRSGGSGVDVFP